MVHQDGCAAKIIKILNSRLHHKKISSAFDLSKVFLTCGTFIDNFLMTVLLWRLIFRGILY